VDYLYSAYDQYIYHGGPSPESVFLSVSGSQFGSIESQRVSERCGWRERS
jgi:hypothetical protein